LLSIDRLWMSSGIFDKIQATADANS